MMIIITVLQTRSQHIIAAGHFTEKSVMRV